MEKEQWKKASLAIASAIRGLELDQVVFHYDYDEAACYEITCLLEAGAVIANRATALPRRLDVGRELLAS